MNFFERQDASRRATRYLVLFFGLAFLAVALATGIVVMVALGLSAGDPGTLAAEPRILLTTVAVVLGLMIIASLSRVAVLSQGGGHVARMLGGTRVQTDDQDPLHRRLLNVVEEMAIASGLPVPEVYVLEQEQGINAFAAGLSPADAAVAVTRGSLEHLDRAELQGVIAHEFSHILNGDMRLNLRLMGFSFGILVLALLGRSMFRASARGVRIRTSRRGKGTGSIVMIALALVVVGYIGVLLSRLIKAAVSRQREVLADASAVQFTREPLALAGALPLLVLLYLLACGIALLASALQVFIRDVGQILPPLMTFWFFATPILYATSILPPGLARIMQFNPMTWYVEKLRGFLLFGDFGLGWSDVIVPVLTLLVLWLGVRFFRRVSPHFEDFL